MLHEMFHIPIPILEKILRPILVYLALIVLLRVFGKRELAQLNPFDLVVLLSLSNTVQNAIIGDDNSLSGGIIGAVALLDNQLGSRAHFVCLATLEPCAGRRPTYVDHRRARGQFCAEKGAAQ